MTGLQDVSDVRHHFVQCHLALSRLCELVSITHIFRTVPRPLAAPGPPAFVATADIIVVVIIIAVLISPFFTILTLSFLVTFIL